MKLNISTFKTLRKLHLIWFYFTILHKEKLEDLFIPQGLYWVCRCRFPALPTYCY